MSTKKTFFHGPEGLKYFFILSLCLHGALLWSILILAKDGGWLARQKVEVTKPEYVQIVELPPDYKVPSSGLKPPKKAKRYADRTSVVEKENIPGGAAIRIRPLTGSKAAQKGRASKAAKALKAAKKTAGVAKPRKIFKTKEGVTRGKGMKKAVLAPEKKASHTTAKKAALKEAELRATQALPLSNGQVIVTSKEKKDLEKEDKSTKTLKSGTISASKGTGLDRGGGEDTLNPEAGQNQAAARAPAARARPNLLLSDSKVSELARKYQGSGPSTKSKTLMLNTSELKYQKYLIDLRHKIEQYWEYPRTAAIRGWQGKLFIDFTIRRDGTISEIRLSKSSRYPILDDAAITALKLSAPFSTFPEDFDIDEIKIHGQFVYNLLNVYRN